MRYSLGNPPKLYARNAAGRLIQIAGRPGEIGRYDNVVLPDERDIHRLRPALSFLAKLKPTSFNYGTTSKDDEPSQPAIRKLPSNRFNRLDALPLFSDALSRT